MILLAVLFIFGAIVFLVLGLAWKEESPVSARLASILSERPSYSQQAENPSIGARVFAPLADSLGRKLERLLPTRWLAVLSQELVRAGEPATLNGFLMAAALAGAAGAGFGFTLALASHSAGSRVLLFVVFGMVIGLYLPRMWLAGRVRVRQKLILKSLPDAFDLITVCVEAGLGLEAALARVSEKVQGPFGEELSVTLREVAMGKLRRDALRELADRTGVPDLTSFISAVVQAETLGTSIATVLRVQAEQMRMRRRQRAERQAQQAPVKMIFPLVLCIFPTMFIVILGPAGLRIMDELGGK